MKDYAPKRFQRFVPDRVPASVAARFTIWLYGIYGLMQGIAILRADPIRFAGPGYLNLREWAGAMTSWGAVAVLLGVAILVGSISRRYWLKTLGVLGMSTWLALFGYGAWAAVIASPLAGPTGPAIYFLASLVCAALMLHDESRKP